MLLLSNRNRALKHVKLLCMGLGLVLFTKKESWSCLQYSLCNFHMKLLSIWVEACMHSRLFASHVGQPLDKIWQAENIIFFFIFSGAHREPKQQVCKSFIDLLVVIDLCVNRDFHLLPPAYLCLTLHHHSKFMQFPLGKSCSSPFIWRIVKSSFV